MQYRKNVHWCCFECESYQILIFWEVGSLCDLASCHLNSWIGSFPLIIIFCKTFTPYILICLPGELVKLSWWQHREKGKISYLSNKKMIQVWDMILFYPFQFATVPLPTRAPNVLVIFPISASNSFAWSLLPLCWVAPTPLILQKRKPTNTFAWISWMMMKKLLGIISRLPDVRILARRTFRQIWEKSSTSNVEFWERPHIHGAFF